MEGGGDRFPGLSVLSGCLRRLQRLRLHTSTRGLTPSELPHLRFEREAAEIAGKEVQEAVLGAEAWGRSTEAFQTVSKSRKYMYHPTTRVLAVLALLRAHGRMTGAELARRLEVDTRTLRRYITMLQDLGVPVVAERGRAGAYALAPDFRLPPLAFTNDEALALALGLLAVQQFGVQEITASVESARAKLDEAMPDDLKGRVRALTETVSLDLDAAQASSPKSVVLALSDAAQTRRRVRLTYHAPRGAATEREFDPYGLANRQGKWYAVGYCHLRRDLRSFRIDRIERVDITDTRFERPEGFDALSHIVQGIATLPRQFTFAVVLKTDLLRAQAEVMEVLGVFEPHADGILLRGSADDIDWLARQLAAFPFPFTVVGPDALRDALRRRADELRAMAD